MNRLDVYDFHSGNVSHEVAGAGESAWEVLRTGEDQACYSSVSLELVRQKDEGSSRGLRIYTLLLCSRYRRIL